MNPTLMCRHSFLCLQARLRRNEHGSAYVEYILLVMLIAIVCLLAVTYFGDSMSVRFSHVGSRVATS